MKEPVIPKFRSLFSRRSWQTESSDVIVDNIYKVAHFDERGID